MQPGKILISFSTNAFIQDEFETVSKSEIEVKGVDYLLKAFVVAAKR